MSGKFPDAIAEALYDLSMNGADDMIGSSSEYPWTWYGKLSDVTPAELEERGVVAKGLPDEMFFILTEDEQGFVDYEQFDTAQDLEARWAEIQQEVDEGAEEE